MSTTVEIFNKQVDLHQIQDVTHSDCVGIAMDTEEFGERVILWADMVGNINDRYKNIRLQPGRGIAGIVYKTARPWIVEDTDRVIPKHEHHRYPILLSEQIKSFFAVPVFDDNRVKAIVLVGYRAPFQVNKDLSCSYIKHMQEISNLELGGVSY